MICLLALLLDITVRCHLYKCLAVCSVDAIAGRILLHMRRHMLLLAGDGPQITVARDIEVALRMQVLSLRRIFSALRTWRKEDP